MFVKHLQEYLDQFTDGKKGNAISNARIYIDVNGHLEEIKDLKQYKSKCIKLENLLQGYKKVIEELSSQVVKK